MIGVADASGKGEDHGWGLMLVWCQLLVVGRIDESASVDGSELVSAATSGA